MARPFKMDYPVNSGPRGNPAQWKAAFNSRMGMDAARAAVGDDSPHGILGVSRDATWNEIKRSYRTLAKTHHPDVGGDPAAFRRIQAAFEILEDKHR